MIKNNEIKCCEAKNCERTTITHPKTVSYCKKANMILYAKHKVQFSRQGSFMNQTKFEPNKIIKYETHAELCLNNKYGEIVSRAIIDIDDIDKVSKYKWFAKKDDRIVTNVVKDNIGKSHIRLHNLIMDFEDYDMYGKMVDHIDRNPYNNKKSNLRIVDAQKNSINRRMQSNNTSGVCGVCIRANGKKYVSQIKFNRKMIRLLYTNNFDDAVLERLIAEKNYFGMSSGNYNILKSKWEIQYRNLDDFKIKTISIDDNDLILREGFE